MKTVRNTGQRDGKQPSRTKKLEQLAEQLEEPEESDSDVIVDEENNEGNTLGAVAVSIGNV